MSPARPCGCPGPMRSRHLPGCTAPRHPSGPSGGHPQFRLPRELGELAAQCVDTGLEHEAVRALKQLLPPAR
jgi:hypothetical protein